MRHSRDIGLLLLVLLSSASIIGCNKGQAQNGGAPPPPEVLVSTPVTKEVTDYADFPGRAESVNSIDLRARVTGYLDKMNFKEGTDVEKGAVLFVIDQRQYKAELNRAEATLLQAEAHVRRLDRDYGRAENLLPNKAISQEEFDKIAGDRAEAVESVGVAKANRELAKLNMSYTEIRAPISGRISRRYIDPGNLVKADDTVLTSILSLDPMYAYFDLDERTTIQVKRLIHDGKIKWSSESGLPVLLGLADQDTFPMRGTINFSDNRVDADSGNWRLRATFTNTDQILSPGMFVHIRLLIGEPYKAILVSEQALATDQGQKFIYVVDKNKKVVYRRIKTGRQHGGLRVITEGVKPNEKVVVSGLQRVRPGVEVNPKVVDMPMDTK